MGMDKNLEEKVRLEAEDQSNKKASSHKNKRAYSTKEKVTAALFLIYCTLYFCGGVWRDASNLILTVFIGCFILNAMWIEDKKLNVPTFGRLKWWYFFVAFSGWIISLVLVSIVKGLTGIENNDSSNEESIQQLIGSGSIGLIVGVVSATVLAPFVEELIFRRGILGNPSYYANGAWKKRMGRILLAILLFAVPHVATELMAVIGDLGAIPALLIALYPYLIMSTILTVLYITFKSLWVTFIFHFINNLFATIITIVILFK